MVIYIKRKKTLTFDFFVICILYYIIHYTWKISDFIIENSSGLSFKRDYFSIYLAPIVLSKSVNQTAANNRNRYNLEDKILYQILLKIIYALFYQVTFDFKSYESISSYIIIYLLIIILSYSEKKIKLYLRRKTVVLWWAYTYELPSISDRIDRKTGEIFRFNFNF